MLPAGIVTDADLPIIEDAAEVGIVLPCALSDVFTLFNSLVAILLPAVTVRVTSKTAVFPLALAYSDAKSTPHTTMIRADAAARAGLLFALVGLSLSAFVSVLPVSCTGRTRVFRSEFTLSSYDRFDLLHLVLHGSCGGKGSKLPTITHP